MASSPIKLKLQHRQSILMENVFSLQQVEQVGIYQHDVVDEIFEEVKNEADEEKQYLQSKINFDNKSSLKVDIEKMLKNRNKKLKKLHKNNKSVSEVMTKMFQTVVRNKTTSPAKINKDITANFISKLKTKDQANPKSVKFNTSIIIPEERSRLSTSYNFQNLNNRSANKSDEVIIVKSSQNGRRDIQTVDNKRVKKTFVTNSISANRGESSEQSTHQTDIKLNNKFRQISTSQNFREKFKKKSNVEGSSMDKQWWNKSEDLRLKFQSVLKTENNISRRENTWFNPQNQSVANRNSPHFSGFLNTVRSNIMKNKSNMSKILQNLRKTKFNKTIKGNNFLMNKLSVKRNQAVSHFEKIQQHMNKLSRVNKRKINQIVNDCYDFETDGMQTLNRIQFEQDFDSIYRDEFNCTLTLLKEIDFAHGNVLDVLYHKKKQDIRDDNEFADKVAKEYRSGGDNR